MSSSSTSLHIGFLFYDFSDSRATEVIDGLAAELGNDRISFFPAGPLNSPAEVAENNRVKVLEAIKKSDLDGLITLQFWESESWFRLMLFDSISCPVVPLLRSYSVASGVVSPYAKGSYDAVCHLIEVHGCRKPYYLIGSSGNSKNLDERFKGYLQALETHGIAYSDEMRISLQGSFSTGGLVSGAAHQGGEAVELLFNKRALTPGADVDALVIFNDKMAMEVTESLAKKGIRVPQDIRIVSFANTADARTAGIPLTTSAIDWESLGSKGLALLKQKINGAHSETTTEVPPQLIIRNSCGCASPVERLVVDNVDALDREQRKALYEEISMDFHAIRHSMKTATTVFRDSSILRNAATILAKCSDLPSFAEAYTLLLSYLNLSECSIYLADPNFSGHYSRHLHWYNQCTEYRFTDEAVSLEAFIPFLGKLPVSVCESLDQGDKHIGFLLFGANDSSFVSFGELRDLLSSTLHSLLLVEHLKETQEQLQLIQKEKLTSLGRLVAGIAHDVNTPLGIGVTASSNLLTEARELKQKFEEGTLSRQSFIGAIDSIYESSEIVLKNLHRADDLIKSFKNVSVKNSSDTVRTFALNEHLQDVVFTLKPLLKNTNLTVTVHCDSSLELISNPGILSQILVNLINNSIKHGYADGQTGNMSITVSPYNSEELLLTYKDDGIGMEAAILEKIYEPFFTTRQNKGGSGLGMFIVFNMVTQKLNGRLNIDSSPGNGITVEIFLPISPNKTKLVT